MRKSLVFVSIVLALSLVFLMVTPALAANEQPLTASVTVNEVISITLTDTVTPGINFGSVSAGVTGQGDVDQNISTPAVKVNVNGETNVNVDIGIKGSTAGTLALTNWKYSTTFAGAKDPIPATYALVYSARSPGSSVDFFHWIDVPGGTAANTYTCTVYYKAVRTGTAF